MSSPAPRRAYPLTARRSSPTVRLGVVAAVAVLVLVVSLVLGALGNKSNDKADVTAASPASVESTSSTPSPVATPTAPSSVPPSRPAATTAPAPASKPAVVPPPVKDGTWLVSQVTGGVPDGRKVAFAVEQGLAIDPSAVATEAIAALNDKRGWAGKGHAFALVTDRRQADVVVHITKPASTDRLCYPLRTMGKVSCTPTIHEIYLNSDRWTKGVPHFKDLHQYRRYLVSHEMGHSLGLGHVPCPGAGKPAPVMLQQTLDLHGCQPNEWVVVA